MAKQSLVVRVAYPEESCIAFVMANDGSRCHHVVVRLTDENFYDGGNGVMPEKVLLAMFPESGIDEMPEFDLVLLDERSYGFGRSYPSCPNYSDEITTKVIQSHLSQLPGNTQQR